jgi:flagellin
MTVINTNTAANLTANAMTQNQRAMNQTMERLSTGSRINSASDDAAGLAIVSKMDAQITGLNQAVRNSNDAIAMIQTADGAAIEVDAMLQRMRELAVQSENATNTGTDLQNLNREFSSLANEIERVATTTQYNNIEIMDQSTNRVFQIGDDNGETMTVNLDTFQLSEGGQGGTAAKTTFAAINNTQTAALNADITFRLFDGQSITLAAADTADLASTAGLAALFNNVATAAGIEVTASGTDAGGLVLTNDLVEATLHTAVLMSAAANATATATTTATGANGGVMGADISAFLTFGSNAEATNTLDQLDAAIAGVAAKRAEYGAWTNRLEHTVDNLTNVSQNTASARSRIEDADYAAETTELARTQIIAQAATAMLSQANQQAQSVLALLK